MREAKRQADAEARAREEFEQDIADEEARRKEAKAKKKAMQKMKLNEEERGREEARKRQEAKAKIEKKIEKRRKRAEEDRQRKQLADAQAEEVEEAIRMEVMMKLNDLKAQEGSMEKEDYVLARIKIKSATVDFGKLGQPNGSNDDLQQIDGIDDGLERRLNTLGITTLLQLSRMDDEASDDVNDAIEYMPGRIRRQLWAEQARILVE